jgi:hypothetical protein
MTVSFFEGICSNDCYETWVGLDVPEITIRSYKSHSNCKAYENLQVHLLAREFHYSQ